MYLNTIVTKGLSLYGINNSENELLLKTRNMQLPGRQEEDQQPKQQLWSCTACTMGNNSGTKCDTCGTPRKQQILDEEENEELGGGKEHVMYHVNGLQKTVNGVTVLPTRTRVVITTVDSAMAFNGSSKAFVEVVQTKWNGVLFQYAPGQSAPSIVG
jgi:hypothetical protein